MQADSNSNSAKAPPNEVEAAYREALRRMGPQGRVQRAMSLYGSIHRMMMHQARQKYPDASERELRLKVAERLYGSDPRTMELIEMARRQKPPDL